MSAGLRVVESPLTKRHSKEQTDTEQDLSRFDGLDLRNYSGKRVLDLVIGTVGFLFYLLLFPFIALGIKLSSSGPVIFRQKRTGIFGKPFTCYKFRTMHMVEKRTQNGQPVVTQKGDSRIFWFGQFLRKTNLDELPQIINVMKGEMSLVGPRPYPVQECRYWDGIFEDHYYRYIVTPGITGHAQARGLRGGTLEEHAMRKRLDFDLIYTEKNNLIFDLKIIWLTIVRMVVSKTNGH
jgi:putative colanic acid biosysnthesis UDP-glucose lipid carrier transferase